MTDDQKFGVLTESIDSLAQVVARGFARVDEQFGEVRKEISDIDTGLRKEMNDMEMRLTSKIDDLSRRMDGELEKRIAIESDVRILKEHAKV